MKTEYDAIVQAGFLLRLDYPDLSLTTSNAATIFGDQVAASEDAGERLRALHLVNSARNMKCLWTMCRNR